MSLSAVILLAFALAADATTVGAFLGLNYREKRQIFRIAFHFGLFQALFPLIGAFGSELLLHYIEAWDHWFIFAVLFGLGARTIWETIKDGQDNVARDYDPTRKWHMIGLSVAVSIDALGAGFALTETTFSVFYAVAIIGVITSLMTTIAMVGAGFVTKYFGKVLPITGGILLIGLGFQILLTHLGYL